MESRGLLEDPPGVPWRVKTLGSGPEQCFWSLFFLGMTAASCARTSPFTGGKGPDAWVQDARISPCHLAVMWRGTCGQQGCVGSCTLKTLAFISLKEKMQGKVGVREISFLSKLFVASVFESQCSHIHSTMPKGWARIQDRTLKSVVPQNHWKQTLNALCSVNTQEVKSSSQALWCIKYQGL